MRRQLLNLMLGKIGQVSICTPQSRSRAGGAAAMVAHAVDVNRFLQPGLRLELEQAACDVLVDASQP